VLDGACADPRGPRIRRALHEEEIAASSVRITLHHHGAVLEVRQQIGRKITVVLQQVALGYSEVGPKDLSQICEF
jgi:hypothetical protein